MQRRTDLSWLQTVTNWRLSGARLCPARRGISHSSFATSDRWPKTEPARHFHALRLVEDDTAALRGIEKGVRAFISQCSGEGLVQQRLLQRLQRGELPLVEAGEALGFFR